MAFQQTFSCPLFNSFSTDGAFALPFISFPKSFSVSFFFFFLTRIHHPGLMELLVSYLSSWEDKLNHIDLDVQASKSEETVLIISISEGIKYLNNWTENLIFNGLNVYAHTNVQQRYICHVKDLSCIWLHSHLCKVCASLGLVK